MVDYIRMVKKPVFVSTRYQSEYLNEYSTLIRFLQKK